MFDQLTQQLSSINSIPILILVALGAWKLLSILHVAYRGFLYFFRSPKNLKKYGPWAVVTGATDGIGLGYCWEFARRGLNVCLVSRSEDKLKAAASEISAKYPNIQVKYIAMDFSKPNNTEEYGNIRSELNGIEVGILVNNVGCSYPHAEYLNDIPDELVNQLIELNVVALTKMTRIVLPQMISRKRGCIVNVGSAAGTMVVGDPLYTVYSATKAYVDFFSKSLNIELASKGIHVENQVPWFVVSKLSKIRRADLFTPNPKTYARAACDRLGYEFKSVPYWTHALQDYLMNHILPVWLVRKLVLKHHLGIRARALKKKSN